MNAKEAFGLILRVLGIVGVLWGISYLTSMVYWLMGKQVPGYSIYHYLVAAVLTLSVGLYFLRGAPHVVRFAFPGTEPPNKAAQEDNPRT
jgi:hypothetical protein